MFDSLFEWFYELFLWIDLFFCKVLSILYSLFDVFAGIKPVTYNGTTKSLLNIFFEDTSARRIYAYMALIGITISFAFTIYAVIRKIFDLDDKIRNSLGGILGSQFKCILFILLMNFVINMVLASSDVLLARVVDIFNNESTIGENKSIKFNNKQYATMARIVNTVGNYSVNASYDSRYNINTCYNEIRGDLIELSDDGVFRYSYSEYPDSWQYYITMIANAHDLNKEQKLDEYDAKLVDAIKSCMKQIWVNNKKFVPIDSYTSSVEPIKSYETPFDVLVFMAGTTNAAKNSKYNVNPDIFDDLRYDYIRKGGKSIYDIGQVEKDFDISLFTFDHLAIIILGFVLARVFLSLCINCIARIFNMVLLYIIAPLFIAVTPLDDGEKTKQWGIAFVVQAFSVFGSIFGIRILMIFVSVIFNSQLVLFESATLNFFAKILMVFAVSITVEQASKIVTGILANSAGYQSIQAADVGSAGAARIMSKAKDIVNHSPIGTAKNWAASKLGHNKVFGALTGSGVGGSKEYFDKKNEAAGKKNSSEASNEKGEGGDEKSKSEGDKGDEKKPENNSSLKNKDESKNSSASGRRRSGSVSVGSSSGASGAAGSGNDGYNKMVEGTRKRSNSYSAGDKRRLPNNISSKTNAAKKDTAGNKESNNTKEGNKNNAPINKANVSTEKKGAGEGSGSGSSDKKTEDKPESEKTGAGYQGLSVEKASGYNYSAPAGSESKSPEGGGAAEEGKNRASRSKTIGGKSMAPQNAVGGSKEGAANRTARASSFSSGAIGSKPTLDGKPADAGTGKTSETKGTSAGTKGPSVGNKGTSAGTKGSLGDNSINKSARSMTVTSAPAGNKTAGGQTSGGTGNKSPQSAPMTGGTSGRKSMETAPKASEAPVNRAQRSSTLTSSSSTGSKLAASMEATGNEGKASGSGSSEGSNNEDGTSSQGVGTVTSADMNMPQNNSNLRMQSAISESFNSPSEETGGYTPVQAESFSMGVQSAGEQSSGGGYEPTRTDSIRIGGSSAGGYSPTQTDSFNIGEKGESGKTTGTVTAADMSNPQNNSNLKNLSVSPAGISAPKTTSPATGVSTGSAPKTTSPVTGVSTGSAPSKAVVGTSQSATANKVVSQPSAAPAKANTAVNTGAGSVSSAQSGRSSFSIGGSSSVNITPTIKNTTAATQSSRTVNTSSNSGNVGRTEVAKENNPVNRRGLPVNANKKDDK